MDLAIAMDIAKRKMKQYSLDDWQLGINERASSLGICKYKIKTIELSRKFIALNEEHVITNTILHEIAHALEWIRHGTRGHQYRWKTIAKEVGCRPESRTKNCIQPEKKYITICRIHGETGKSNLKKNSACRLCCNLYNKGEYSEKYELTYKRNEKLN